MMRSRITELGCKEVINVCNGTRYGFVNDVEIDCATGRVVAIIIHSRCKFNVFTGKKEDVVVPWEQIKHIGEDIILVE